MCVMVVYCFFMVLVYDMFLLVYGMPVAPVRLWSSCGAFLFLLVPSPSGIYEILGTKLGSPGSTPRNAHCYWTGVWRAAFRIL